MKRLEDSKPVLKRACGAIRGIRGAVREVRVRVMVRVMLSVRVRWKLTT